MRTKNTASQVPGVTDSGAPPADMSPFQPDSTGGDLISPFLEIDGLALDTGEPNSSGPGSTGPYNNLQQNDCLELNFDDLWSADFVQVPPDAHVTELSQTPVGWCQLQHSEIPQHFATLQDEVPQNASEIPSRGLEHILGPNRGSPTSSSPHILTPGSTALPPKVGHRFTLESLRALKDWFSRHSENPYPTEEEKVMLEQQTGLSRTQVTNWLANSRRRRPTAESNIQTTSTKSGRIPSDYTPTRRGTPIPRRPQTERDMHPLQRWVDSPPENEPAAVSAIARAMASGDLVSSRSRRGTFSNDEKLPRRRRHRSITSSLDDAHLAAHNPSACQERVFSRKDHLKQHLRLVHNAALTDLSTRMWRTAQPDIVSRCGFCQASLSTWLDRVDHLANHFKMGCTMSKWVGDWGFEDSVLKSIEKALPPYLVELERGTPFPFAASGKPPDSPCSAYELITMELAYFISNHHDTVGVLPSHTSLQLEACRIVFASEVAFPISSPDSHRGSSWFRDLLLSNEDIAQQARFGPIRSKAESRLSLPEIKGKTSLFEDCPLESRLQTFCRRSKVVEVSNADIQNEARRIIMQMESELQTEPEYVANWLIGFLYDSKSWIDNFRRRSDLKLGDNGWELPSSHQLYPGDTMGQSDTTPWITEMALLDENVWDFGELSAPSNANMPFSDLSFDTSNNQIIIDDASPRDFTWLWSGEHSAPVMLQTNKSPAAEGSALRPSWLGPGIYVLNDPNHILWFAREMKRWVKAAMSPNNPICHVPSDEELRHQARCLLYNDDDPWNQTPADNGQWLEMFKKEVGIITGN
ncbi:hypothetical protein FAVG1_02968 [Fusarium avenaceum]|nr:hypothetical protein FAVG1_02968 [Fusarium avenaceum]